MPRADRRLLGLLAVWLCAAAGGGFAPHAAPAAEPFAARVVAFEPAPGQFVNVPLFMDAQRTRGAPVGGGTIQPDNSKIVSLGGFGGRITLAFAQPVQDDPANPFGLDCIVYGNAVWAGGQPWRKWAEAAMIEISRDANANGLADDPWYLVPGSHLASPPPPRESQTWDDNTADPTWPPGDPAWIPPGYSGTWTTWADRLPAGLFETNVLVHPLGETAEEEIVWGYADVSPTLLLGDLDGDNIPDDPNLPPEIFYTRPDDPLRVGVTRGCGGGDAFDIAWAIDPQTGAPAGLGGFDFLRITTTANVVLPLLGEKSAEIAGAADVAEGRFGDAENDGDLDFEDYAYLAQCLHGAAIAAPTCPCRVLDFQQDGDVDLHDVADFQAAFGPEGGAW